MEIDTAPEEGLQEPGPSQETTPDTEFIENDEQSKGEFTNAIKHTESLLRSFNLITDAQPDVISAVSIAMGEVISSKIIEMLGDRKIIDVEELIGIDELDELQEYSPCEGVAGDDDEYVAEEFAPEPHDYVPLSYKERAVALAAAHPKWSLKSLQKKGCSRLKHKQTLYRWREDVKRGGTKFDKWNTINSETYERFLEARRNFEQVTTRTLQQWAMNAAFPFLSDSFNFTASSSWVERFKKTHKIRQRKIKKFISSKELATMDEVLASAERFRVQTKKLIPNFNLDYVINTDATSCQYQSTYNRSKKDFDQIISHSYSAQYALTASGKIFPFVFLCMQEPSGKFSPTVKKRVAELTDKFKNVYVTCTKSGKLTKQVWEEFLKSVVHPYVGQEKFLFIIDSWEGQTDQTLYDHIFVDGNMACTCTVKVIPPKCTALCQPCDVYFYRQVKIFINKLQNAPELLKANREIASREDSIRIHSLVLHQLTAPAFRPMIQYAWFASKLIDERTIFLNVNDLCFSITNLKQPCVCKAVGFIKCAWCCTVLCFTCFYDNYHPQYCSATQADSDTE